jgi:hypothetical protein
MAFGTRVIFEAIRLVAFGALTNAYAALGAATTMRARIVAFKNTTDQDVLVSLDGTTNHLRIASGSGEVLDFTANKTRDDGLYLPEGTVFYVKYASQPTVGNFWIELMAAAGGI